MGKLKSNYQDSRNWLEWSAFATGLELVIIIVGYLIYKTTQHNEGPPQLFVEYFHEPGKYEPNRFHVTIHKNGAQNAESIRIELTLGKGGKELGKAQLDIAFFPRESSREDCVSFSTEPVQADTIQARVMIYKNPDSSLRTT